MPREQANGAPTIRDVAELAGVSKSLVSLVLNNSTNVRPAKRQAVLDAVRDLGYRPNAAARSLTERRTRSVGVLMNDLRNPWFVDCLEGLNAELHANDMTMLLGDARLDRRADERLVNTFMDMRVDGLVLVGSMTPSPAVLEAAARLPTVVAGSRDIAMPRVDISAQDDVLGARLATRHLIDLGHRRIAHVTGTFESVAQDRRASYEDTMRAAGLADQILVVAAEFTEQGGHEAAMQILGHDPRPTALFVAADIAALGALRAAAHLGLRVPEDLSVIGYDNTYVARLETLGLTSVDITSEQIGRVAARLLLTRIRDPRHRRCLKLAVPTVAVRATTAPPST